MIDKVKLFLSKFPKLISCVVSNGCAGRRLGAKYTVANPTDWHCLF